MKILRTLAAIVALAIGAFAQANQNNFASGSGAQISGTPTSDQIALWVNSTQLQGVSTLPYLTLAGSGAGTLQLVQGTPLSPCPTNTPQCIQANAFFFEVPATIAAAFGWMLPNAVSTTGGLLVAAPSSTDASGNAVNVVSLSQTPTLGGVGLGTGMITYAGNTSGSVTVGCSAAACVFFGGGTTAANFGRYTSGTNCSSSASPAVCTSASAGSVVVAASATTVVVDTTAVTANSQVNLTFDSSLGTKLSVTCNTTFTSAWVSARTAATSFTITVSTAPTTNPACFSYTIEN